MSDAQYYITDDARMAGSDEKDAHACMVGRKRVVAGICRAALTIAAGGAEPPLGGGE